MQQANWHLQKLYEIFSGAYNDVSRFFNVNLATALSKDTDSVDVGKMSKTTGIPVEMQAIVATTTSNEINAAGYNSMIVIIEPTGGTWTGTVQGSPTSGGTFLDLYDGATQMATGAISTARGVLFRGLTDYVKLIGTKGTGTSANIKYVLLNL